MSEKLKQAKDALKEAKSTFKDAKSSLKTFQADFDANPGDAGAATALKEGTAAYIKAGKAVAKLQEKIDALTPEAA